MEIGQYETISLPPVRIIQLLNMPNDERWRGRLLGLGEDGATYEVNPGGIWILFIPPLREVDAFDNSPLAQEDET